MSDASRRLAGLLLLLLPTVVFGGTSLLTLLITDPAYQANALRQDLWRAGHAHAGVMLLLSLIALRYVDDAVLGDRARGIARHAFPAAALLLSAGFFLSVPSPDATEPNALISLSYVGAVVLVVGMVLLGFGLVRRREAGARVDRVDRQDLTA